MKNRTHPLYLRERNSIAMVLCDIFNVSDPYDTHSMWETARILFPTPVIVAISKNGLVKRAWDKFGQSYVWADQLGCWFEERNPVSLNNERMRGIEIITGKNIRLKGEIVFWLPQ